MELPVQKSFFPSMRLSPKETYAYFNKAKRALEQVREAATTFSWKRIENKDGLVMGKVHCIEQKESSHVGKSTASLVVRGTTTVRATVAEVVELLGTADTTEHRQSMRRLHGKHFVDSMTLEKIENGCHVKWIAFKEADAMVDYCYLEYVGMIPEGTSSTVGFCVMHSIDRPREVPPLTALGYRREEYHRTGFLVYPSLETPDSVHVTTIAQGSPHKMSVERLEAWLHQRISRVLLRVGEVVTMRRLGAIPAVHKSQWVHDTSRKFCAVCLKSFNFARKHHCRLCGEVVCGNCAMQREVDIPTLSSSAWVRVCSGCVTKAHSVAESKTDERLSNQIDFALNEFDVIDRRALAEFSDSGGDEDDDKDSDRSSGGGARIKPQRATSLDATQRRPSITLLDSSQLLPGKNRSASSNGRILYHASELDYLRDQGLTAGESHGNIVAVESPVAAQTATTRLQNVHELFTRLTQIRDTLNQNIAKASPSSGKIHWREDAVEILDEEDDDDIDDTPKHHDVSSQASQDDSSSQEEPPVATKADDEPATTTHDVALLRSEISQLQRLLEAANQRLDAVEASAAKRGSVEGLVERAARYVEMQSGNASRDPVVVRRRRAHDAVVQELREVMGL
ncbi:unnamed protein product [Aphanomyces euteiches]|uniref:FYVE-type domain-containing protein n=1 Tax=Aphanomyces euteiches TaxID=100861 RepID=A0A6G0XSA7_9STRA|nr:hypothetical protein Ae201684_001846 [Aphanomyces euteiches]KAH9089497.1 hypothetical protein Ae201684P_007667 [Aphanomyces euteiches]